MNPAYFPQRQSPPGNASEKRRSLLLLILLGLFSMMLVSLVTLFVLYLSTRRPLPELMPGSSSRSVPPHYVFSIYNVNKPVSVAVSPQGDLVYAAEGGGERLVKIFDRDGILVGSFAPPLTSPPERAPVYVATDPYGHVYVSDRAQHAIFIYDSAGSYLDTILNPDQTLSEYLYSNIGELSDDTLYAYNIYYENVFVQRPGEALEEIPAPEPNEWAPLGVRTDSRGRLFVTDVSEGRNAVYVFPGDVFAASDWKTFEPQPLVFGESGSDAAQLSFPNNAAIDHQGRIYVVDGNNSRVSVWNEQGEFLFHFGRGSGDGVINLPRGIAIDEQDRLYVVDAVDQRVKVYDVSVDEIAYLFSFGDFGREDGLFNYPNDIGLDAEGHLYVADRENDRIQVWMY